MTHDLRLFLAQHYAQQRQQPTYPSRKLWPSVVDDLKALFPRRIVVVFIATQPTPSHLITFYFLSRHSFRRFRPDGTSDAYIFVEQPQVCEVRESWSFRIKVCIMVVILDFPFVLIVPRRGFEPQFLIPKINVLPLDDRGIMHVSPWCHVSHNSPSMISCPRSANITYDSTICIIATDSAFVKRLHQWLLR